MSRAVLLSILCAALTASCAASGPITQNTTGVRDGRFHTFWRDTGEAEMRLGPGGAYAVEWLASRHGLPLTVVTATDGNHGRSVAWGAMRAGAAAKVLVHPGVSKPRREAIAAYGAEIIEAGARRREPEDGRRAVLLAFAVLPLLEAGALACDVDHFVRNAHAAAALPAFARRRHELQTTPSPNSWQFASSDPPHSEQQRG